MQTKIPIYEAKLLEADTPGIFAMSFVDVPANERNFVALATAAAPVKLSLDKHKQTLTGAVLIPNQLIYRNDNAMGEYYLRFTAQDIERIAEKMMKTGVALSTTTHQHERPLAGNHLTECWIVQNAKNDKSNALGMDLPKGSLVATYKIGDAAYWRTQVLTGEVKGFSIEGLFNFKNVTMNKPVIKTQAQKDALLPPEKGGTKLGAFFKSMAAFLDGDTAGEAKDLAGVAKADETDSGTPVIIFELQDGGEIDVDSAGFCTMQDGTQAPAGDHQLTDGNFISIDDQGMLVTTTDSADATPAAAAPATLTAQQKKAREDAKARGVALMKGEDVVLPGEVKPVAAAKVPAKTENEKKIAALEAQIATLKATPSTGGKAKAAATTEVKEVELTREELKALKPHERAAVVLKMRQKQAAE